MLIGPTKSETRRLMPNFVTISSISTGRQMAEDVVVIAIMPIFENFLNIFSGLTPQTAAVNGANSAYWITSPTSRHARNLIIGRMTAKPVPPATSASRQKTPIGAMCMTALMILTTTPLTDLIISITRWLPVLRA